MRIVDFEDFPQKLPSVSKVEADERRTVKPKYCKIQVPMTPCISPIGPVLQTCILK